MDNLKKELLQQTAKISWLELQRFFAQGKVLLVSEELDLIEIAVLMSQDQAADLKPLLDSEKLSYPSNSQAKKWFASDAILWSVVVAPFVLVQEKDLSQGP